MKLKQWRKSIQKSQGWVGKQLGVSGQSVGWWESGRNRPDLETIFAIQDLTEGSVTPEDFRKIQKKNK